MYAPFSLISGTSSAGLTTTKRPLFSTDDTEPKKKQIHFLKLLLTHLIK
jgi:hypothetical protein